jgi:hypothetical protein
MTSTTDYDRGKLQTRLSLERAPQVDKTATV